MPFNPKFFAKCHKTLICFCFRMIFRAPFLRSFQPCSCNECPSTSSFSQSSNAHAPSRFFVSLLSFRESFSLRFVKIHLDIYIIKFSGPSPFRDVGIPESKNTESNVSFRKVTLTFRKINVTFRKVKSYFPEFDNCKSGMPES